MTSSRLAASTHPSRKDGCSIQTDFFVVKSVKTAKKGLFIVLSKKKVPTAVARNTIKRRIRAVFSDIARLPLNVTVQPRAVDERTPISAYREAAALFTKTCESLLKQDN